MDRVWSIRLVSILVQRPIIARIKQLDLRAMVALPPIITADGKFLPFVRPTRSELRPGRYRTRGYRTTNYIWTGLRKSSAANAIWISILYLEKSRLACQKPRSHRAIERIWFRLEEVYRIAARWDLPFSTWILAFTIYWVDEPEALNVLPVQEAGYLQRYWLSYLCLLLHIMLVFGHIGLFISTIKHWEHQFTFPVENQTVVSFWTTIITQGFGTVTPKSLLVPRGSQSAPRFIPQFWYLWLRS